MSEPRYGYQRHRFKAAWCECGHSFNNEVELRDGEADLLITAAAWQPSRDNYGQPQLSFAIVTHCPSCGRVCDQAWADECYAEYPGQYPSFVMGRHDPADAGRDDRENQESAN